MILPIIANIITIIMAIINIIKRTVCQVELDDGRTVALKSTNLTLPAGPLQAQTHRNGMRVKLVGLLAGAAWIELAHIYS